MQSANPFLDVLRRFSTNQRLPVAELERLQSAKLRNVVRHAAVQVPLFRDLYREHGVDPLSIAGADDLWRLPAVAKEDYLRVGASKYVDGRRDLAKLKVRTTSGSLGHPLSIYSTRLESFRLHAALWSAWLGLGVTARDRLFMMNAPYLATKLPPFESDFAPPEMPMEEVIERFRALQPTVVIGSGESIALLGQEVARRNLPEGQAVRQLYPFGQTLTMHMRRMMQAGFPGEIFNLYGAGETAWMGYECELHDGLHVPADRAIVQIARLGQPDQPAAQGELGEIIVTSLERITTPFIRYRIYDVATLDNTPCPCGRTTPRLRSLEGRVQDFFLSLSGALVSPQAVYTELVLDPLIAMIDHRIVQETPRRVRLLVVPGPEFGDPSRQAIEAIMRRNLGDVQIVIEPVAEIPRDPSGKRRRAIRLFDLPENPR